MTIINQKYHYQMIAQLFMNGKLDSAKKELNKTIKLFGDSHNSYFYGGAIAFSQNKISKAVKLFRKAAKLQPDNIKTTYNLGIALERDRIFADAMSCFNTVIKKDPNHIPSLLMIATIFDKTGNPFSAKLTANIILSLSPNNPTALEIIANTSKNIGDMNQAVAQYEKLLKIYPDNFSARSSMLLATNYGTFSTDKIEKMHIENSKFFVAKTITTQPKSIPQNNKITVGFVSADFCAHAVAYFLESILSNFNHEKFNIIGYSNTEHKDKITTRLKNYCTSWKDIYGLATENVANQIRQDEVDILVDLSGHTGGNRLLLFGLKPAPIQLSYIGYPASTGLSTIDYRITDTVTDFENKNLIRLRNFFLAYTPPPYLPPTNFLATNSRNYTLFGSFNSTAKYSEKTIKLWSRVLKKVKNSKLLIKHRHFNDHKLRARMGDRFFAEGISKSQIIFKEYTFSDPEHLKEYNNIDLALDSTPYNGTTTTFEAAIMGVPTISLRGDRHSDRVGVSILTTLGLPEFIAETEDQFVDIAKKMDENRTNLVKIKEGLRTKFLNSPLCDGARLTLELEDVFIKLCKNYF